jgi:MoaD family protein
MSTVKFRLVATLASIVGKDQVELEADTVQEALTRLSDSQGQRLQFLLFSEAGKLNPRVRVYVNNKDIRFLDKLDTPLQDGDTLLVLPAVTGG